MLTIAEIPTVLRSVMSILLIEECLQRATDYPDRRSHHGERRLSTSTDLAALFRRDLARLGKQIEAFPSDEALWQAHPAVTNAAGNLALHLEGNLREYVGRQLGNLPYSRNRPLEFSAKGLSREELGRRVADVHRTIPGVIEALSPQQLAMEYPEKVLDAAMTTAQFLIHLYGHLNWHLGQMDYLRRIVTGESPSGPKPA
jgi:hypothetical protein